MLLHPRPDLREALAEAIWLAVDLPLSPRALATFTANLFQGIEVELLAGVGESEAPHREVLDAVGALIAQAENR